MGYRQQYVDRIENSLKVPENKRVNTPHISAKGSHKLYEELVGEPARPMKGKGWHLKKSIEAVGGEPMKSYADRGVKAPLDKLKLFDRNLP